MDLKETKKGNVVILPLEWKLDVKTSPEVEAKILELFKKGEKNFILDFANVNYISSSGLRVILLAEKKAKEAGGKVLLTGVQEHVKNVFDISGFTDLLIIKADNEEALKEF